MYTLHEHPVTRQRTESTNIFIYYRISIVSKLQSGWFTEFMLSKLTKLTLLIPWRPTHNFSITPTNSIDLFNSRHSGDIWQIHKRIVKDCVCESCLVGNAWWGLQATPPSPAHKNKEAGLAVTNPPNSMMELCDTADSRLFAEILHNPHHVLHNLLPRQPRPNI